MPLVLVMNADFKAASDRVPLSLYDTATIYQRMTLRISEDQHYVASAGSYWKDSNHIPYYLNLLAVMYREDQTTPLGEPGMIPKEVGNLRGGKFVFRTRTNGRQPGMPGFYLPQRARIGFWVQSYDKTANGGEGRYVNYFQGHDLLCEAMGVARPFARNGNDAIVYQGDWVDVTVRLEGKYFTPLRSSAAKYYDYGESSDPDLALGCWRHDCGIIVCMNHDPSTYIYPVGYNGGEFHLDCIKLYVDSELNPGAVAL